VQKARLGLDGDAQGEKQGALKRLLWKKRLPKKMRAVLSRHKYLLNNNEFVWLTSIVISQARKAKGFSRKWREKRGL
jgi:hypothetical protein